MAQKIRVQDNNVVYQSTDEGTDVELSVYGKVIIGKNTTTDVITTINGANLLIKTTKAGHMVVTTISDVGTGILEINNVQWPANFDQLKDGATMFVEFDAVDGQFKLRYSKMAMGSISGSVVTPAALSTLFPKAKPGQFVTTPDHVLLNTGTTGWYSMSAAPISASGALVTPGGGTGSGAGSVTSIDFLTGTTGLTTSGGPVTTAGAITLAGTLAIAHGGTGATSATAARSALGAQEVLVSGTNIRTVNGVSILGSGDIPIPAGSGTGGTVASVNVLTGTTGLTATGGPVTVSGTITLGGVLNVINGGTGATTPSAARTALSAQELLVSGTNIKTVNGVTVLGSGNISIPAVTFIDFLGGTTGLTTSGGPVTSAGTITLAGTLSIANGGTGATSALAARTSLDAQVTLVSGTNIKTINGNSILGSGNIVLSGGGSTGTVTSVSLSGGTTGLTASGTPITTSGTITLAGTLSIANGGTGATSAAGALTALGAQSALVSGTSIKTINGTTLLGSGNVVIGGVTSVALSGGSTGLTASGGPITSAGTITLAGTLAIANGGTGATSALAARTSLGAQSVLVSGTNIKTINGTSILGSGDIVIPVATGLTAGSASTGYITYSGTTATPGQWYGSTTLPTGTTRLTYNGKLVANNPLFKDGANVVGTYATVGVVPTEGNTTNYGIMSWDNAALSTNVGAIGPNTTTNLIAGGTHLNANSVMQLKFDRATLLKDFYVNGTASISGNMTCGGTAIVPTWRANIRGGASTDVAIMAYTPKAGASTLVSCVSSTSTQLARWVYGVPGVAGNVDVGYITTNGASTTYATTSDYRLKSDVVPMTGAAERLMGLKPKRFKWKALPGSMAVDGFIAHEVTDIVPESVVGEKDAVDDNGHVLPQSMDYSKLVPLLTSALQEALMKINILEHKISQITV